MRSKGREREADNPCGFGALIKRILAWKVLNYCKIKKIAAEWGVGGGVLRTSKPPTLTSALTKSQSGRAAPAPGGSAYS